MLTTNKMIEVSKDFSNSFLLVASGESTKAAFEIAIANSNDSAIRETANDFFVAFMMGGEL